MRALGACCFCPCRWRAVASNHLAALGCHLLSPRMGGDVRERHGPQLSALRGRTHDRCMRSRGADRCRCMLCCGPAITSPRSMYRYLFMDIHSASSPYSCTYMYIHFFSKSMLHFIEPYCRVHKPRVPRGLASQQRLGPSRQHATHGPAQVPEH